MLSAGNIILICLFIASLVAALSRHFLKGYEHLLAHFRYTWLFFLCFVVAELFSISAGVWVLAFLSFSALREYFSIVNIRLQDRLGILGAYLTIPFMIYFIQDNWYGMFIISIPVYSFLTIPLLITLGGRETEGTLFSIGAIVFGMFLFVYCIGHIGYLLLFSVWMAVMLIANVAVCSITAEILSRYDQPVLKNLLLRFALPAPITVGITIALSGWGGMPMPHSIILGLMIPILVIMGQHVGNYVEADLRVDRVSPAPGSGQILDNIKPLFFAAPVVFHYIRYFLIP